MTSHRLKKQAEIADAIERTNEGLEACAVDSFLVSRNSSGKWEVWFNWNNRGNYKLCTKHGVVREFPRLNGVQLWMEEVGVAEFRVIL